MAHIDAWKPNTQIPNAAEGVKRELRRHFWQWYREHKDDVIVERRILFWSLSIRVRDLRFLFEQLFGAELF